MVIMGSAFTSCKKCYQCTTTVEYEDIGLGTPAKTTETSEFCGSKKQKKEREAAGTGTATMSMGGLSLTQTMKTTCN